MPQRNWMYVFSLRLCLVFLLLSTSALDLLAQRPGSDDFFKLGPDSLKQKASHMAKSEGPSRCQARSSRALNIPTGFTSQLNMIAINRVH